MGDVLPFVNLGVGFLRRGHNVIIAANSRFQSFIEEKGFAFREIKVWNTCSLVACINRYIYLFNLTLSYSGICSTSGRILIQVNFFLNLFPLLFNYFYVFILIYLYIGRRMVKFSSYSILGSPFMFNFLKQGFQKSYR